MLSTRTVLVAFVAFTGLVVSPQAGAAPGEAAAQLVVSGLTSPMVASGPSGDSRLFVVERAGRVQIVENGTILTPPFLDISGAVNTNGEMGLLGIAFAPDYVTSGRFYVHYNDTAGDSRIVRYRVSSNRDVADPASAEAILLVDQPAHTNHKAGSIAFGPDGFLWFPTGDGGGADDPDELAQDPESLLGKLLRIDVGPSFASGSIQVPGALYRIPADNPFVGSSTPLDEIWALGLRNPYRSSFDRLSGDFWLTDVGQTAREEVNFVAAGDPGGSNFGWDVMEGTTCNPNDPAPAPPCNSPVFTPPLVEYDQSAGNCAIIGGNVYRTRIDPLYGHYFFGDFCSGRIYSLDPATGVVTDRTQQLGAAGGIAFSLVGFGEDGRGRLHVVHTSGSVYRIQPADPACSDGVDNDGDGLSDYPADPGCASPSGATEFSGFSCGIGPELSGLLALLLALRQRRRAPRS